MGSLYEAKANLGKRRNRSFEGGGPSYKKAKMFMPKKFRLAPVKKALGVQTKKINIPQASTATAATTAVVLHMSAIPRGAGETERVGNRILTQNINVRGTVQRNAAGASGQYVRIVLIQDTQNAPDAVTPTWADVYGSDANSHFNEEHTGRYKQLDQCFICVAPDQSVMPFALNSNKKISIRYNGAASTDIDLNGIFMMAIGDPFSGANGPSVAARTRIAYTDM